MYNLLIFNSYEKNGFWLCTQCAGNVETEWEIRRLRCSLRSWRQTSRGETRRLWFSLWCRWEISQMEYFAFQWHITDECDQRCKHCYILSGFSSCVQTWCKVAKKIVRVTQITESFSIINWKSILIFQQQQYNLWKIPEVRKKSLFSPSDRRLQPQNSERICSGIRPCRIRHVPCRASGHVQNIGGSAGLLLKIGDIFKIL